MIKDMINTEDFLRKKGICSDTTIGIEGDYLLTDLLEEYLDVNTSDIDKRIASIAIEALENIANPLNYLLEEAKKERRSLNAYIAGKLMENPYFYADIAEKALRLIKQTKAMQEELILKERSKE